MPKAMEQALSKEASKKGLKGKRRNAYIYGLCVRWDGSQKENANEF